MDVAVDQPKGIGGWLALPAISLVMAPFVMLYQFYRSILPLLSPGVWQAVTTPGSLTYDPLWAPLIIFEVSANVITFLLLCFLILVFFRKARITPKVFILFLVLGPIVQILDYIWVSQIPAAAEFTDSSELAHSLVRTIVPAFLWIPYFLVSKRVHNTFTEPAVWWRHDAVRPADDPA